MKTRGSKTLAFGAALIMATLAMNSAFAEGGRKVHMRFAGAFIQNIVQMDVDAFGQSVETSTVGLVRTKAKGNLGRADLTSATKSKPAISPEDDRCPVGFMKVADITDNNLVFTFANLSLLYGDGDGVVCINFANGEQFVAVDGIWLGGTGRFRNATGEFSIRFDEFVVVSPKTQLVAESGTVTGTLSRGK
jgi:hypothetical protein